jgi:hypothetical protein
MQVEVDLERLGLGLLVLEHAADARQPQAADLHHVAVHTTAVRTAAHRGRHLTPWP